MLQFLTKLAKRTALAVTVVVGFICSPVLLPSIVMGAVTSYSMLFFWAIVRAIFEIAKLPFNNMQPTPATAMLGQKEITEGLPSRSYVEKEPEIKEVREGKAGMEKEAREKTEREREVQGKTDAESPAGNEEAGTTRASPEAPTEIPSISTVTKLFRTEKSREVDEKEASEIQADVKHLKKAVGISGDETKSPRDEMEEILEVVFDGHKPEGTQDIKDLKDVKVAMEKTQEELGVPPRSYASSV